MQGVQRYVIFAYLTIGILLWVTLSKLLAALAYAVDIPDSELLGSQFTATTLASLCLAMGAAFFALRNEKVYGFSAEVVGELRKVTWPSKKETQAATIVVTVTTLVISGVLGLFDAIWSWATSLIY